MVIRDSQIGRKGQIVTDDTAGEPRSGALAPNSEPSSSPLSPTSGPEMDSNTDHHVDLDPATAAETVDPASFVTARSNPLKDLDGAAPIFLFVIINARFFFLSGVGTDRIWFGAAVAASVAWSIKTVVRRRRQGQPIGRFTPVVTAWLVIKGLVGILTGNEDIFFGMSIGAKVAIGLALIVSVVIGKSFCGTAAPMVFGFSDAIQEHSSYISAMSHITLVGAFYEFFSAIFDVWLLFVRDASANQFVLVRYGVNWGASSIVIFGAMAYLGRRLQEIPGFPGVMAIFEAHVEATAERLGWDLSEREQA